MMEFNYFKDFFYSRHYVTFLGPSTSCGVKPNLAARPGTPEGHLADENIMYVGRLQGTLARFFSIKDRR